MMYFLIVRVKPALLLPIRYALTSNRRRLLWLLFLTGLSNVPASSLAQADSLRQGMMSCGADTWLEQARRNPLYVQEEKALNLKIRDRVLSMPHRQKPLPVTGNKKARAQAQLQKAAATEVYTLPIVFHIVSDQPDSTPDQAVFDALESLNDAFAHRNAYSVDTNGVDTYIQFCLARTTPDGGLTNGIDRVTSFYGDHDMDLEGGKPQGLTNWDPSRYVNVWVVNSIQSEMLPSKFKCGGWQRMYVGGYAGPGWGAVVWGMGTPLVAHELGHYLSLAHTFQGMNCLNNDCLLDGDMVCDTPPDKSIDGSPCNNPENSCNTDTLSGPFTKDERDNISNFMDYGSPCPTVFTQGQADRMRAFIELYYGNSLLKSTACTPPCTDTLLAKFNWNTNPHPKTGDSVDFTNTSVGGLRYQWYVNGVLVDSTMDLRYGFAADGAYKVVLLAYGADSLCFSSYTGTVFVNCGVYARFSPVERAVASKKDMYSSPVRFWNKSWGATEYSWYIRDISGNDSMVSNDKDLVYDFPEPGSYQIRLVAKQGDCVDQSPVFTLNVEDPTPDAQINFKQIDCYKDDSIRIVFGITNSGFDSIPANVPVTFYDRPANTPGAQLLSPVFYTDTFVIGKCEQVFVHIVKAAIPKQDYIAAVVNEDKRAFEGSYTNNTTAGSGFKYVVGIDPPLQKVYVHSDTVVKLQFRPNHPLWVNWTSNMALSCASCDKPVIRVTDTTDINVKTESLFSCHDSAVASIHVYPLDLQLKTQSVFCYKNDSMLITEQVCLGNRYRSIKRDVNMNFYDQAPATPGAQLLGSLRVPRETVFTDSCTQVTTLIKMTTTGMVHTYINDPLSVFEDSMRNNLAAIPYTPFRIRFAPTSINVYRNEPRQLGIVHSGEPWVRLLWTPAAKLSCADCPDPLLTTTNNEMLKVMGMTRYWCTDSAYLDVHAFSRNHLVLPNVFTPNGDGRNDYFYVIASNKVSVVKQFQIFNRWGEKVFERVNGVPNDYAAGWDGTFRGAPSPTGTYVYVVVVQLTTGETETYQGNISILR